MGTHSMILRKNSYWHMLESDNQTLDYMEKKMLKNGKDM